MADPTGVPVRRPPEERGRTTIADKVVERVASMAAREVESVADTRTGLTRLVRGALPQASVVVAGGTTRIKVDVAATWPTPLSGLAVRVREHVAQQVTELVGLSVTAVDVSIADVVHAETAQRRVQ